MNLKRTLTNTILLSLISTPTFAQETTSPLPAKSPVTKLIESTIANNHYSLGNEKTMFYLAKKTYCEEEISVIYIDRNPLVNKERIGGQEDTLAIYGENLYIFHDGTDSLTGTLPDSISDKCQNGEYEKILKEIK